jgi:hypothetical protein
MTGGRLDWEILWLLMFGTSKSILDFKDISEKLLLPS